MALEEKVEFGTAPQFPVADEDFTMVETEKMLKVDLACGGSKSDGFIGMDKFQRDGVDIVHDLMTFPWPLKDNSVYEFHCSHYVEHIPIQLADGTYGLNAFMEEVYRCLMPSGTIVIHAPYYTSMEAWQDPTHTRAITDRTFAYYDRESMEKFKLDHYTAKCNFEMVSRTYVLFPEWESRAPEVRSQAIRIYNNVVQEIRFVLRKR